MVLPMPAEVISTVHQLAVACKKYNGITFNNKDSNIINDHNDPEEINGPDNDNIEITGVNNRMCNYGNRNSENLQNLEITGVDTTGVWVLEITQQNNNTHANTPK